MKKRTKIFALQCVVLVLLPSILIFPILNFWRSIKIEFRGWINCMRPAYLEKKFLSEPKVRT